MELHSLQKVHKTKSHKRVGRGGSKGRCSGRGMKGQKSRSGSKAKPRVGFAGGDTLPYKKIPKKRGHKFKSTNKKVTVSIGIGRLDKFFNDNDKISPQILAEKGLIKKIRGTFPEVKLLANGKLNRKLLVENCQISEAVAKIMGIVSKENKTKRVEDKNRPMAGKPKIGIKKEKSKSK